MTPDPLRARATELYEAVIRTISIRAHQPATVVDVTYDRAEALDRIARILQADRHAARKAIIAFIQEIPDDIDWAQGVDENVQKFRKDLTTALGQG